MSARESANQMEKGSRRYREKIHRESRYADTHKNLPYKFSKPTKSKPSNILVICDNCGKDLHVTEDTIIVICGPCKHMNRVSNKKSS